MKHLYVCLSLLLGLLLGLVSSALGYNYHPFHPFLRYHLSEGSSVGDSTFSVRLNFGNPPGPIGPFFPDSTYWLNSRATPVAQRRSGGCDVTYVVGRRGGLFGASILVTSRQAPMLAEYVLRATNGRTFTLKPRAALNQPWAATANGITARVTARGVASVFGQPDSVVTITLSDGQSMRIAKHYGWLEGPALGAYLNGQRPRYLTTTALEGEFGVLGQPKVGTLVTFDYQPGDVFLRYRRQESTQTSSLCSETWQRDSVETRRVSRTGDTVTYTITTRTLTRNYGHPSAPFGMCQNTPGATITGPSTGTLVVARQQAHITNPAQQPYLNSEVAVYAARGTDYNGRMQLRTQWAPVCGAPTATDSLQLMRMVDVGGMQVYAAGLGLVGFAGGDVAITSQLHLIGYRKVNLPTSTGVETWGALRTFANILKAADYHPAAGTAVFPNPFERQLTVHFAAQRAQTVTARLYNGLGQLVEQRQQAVAAGSAELALRVPALPAGLYTLHLQHDGRTEVLKVTRQQ
jgi:hypothetical protein